KRAEETQPHTVLSGIDTNPGAAAELVHVVGNVHDIKPRFQLAPGPNLEALLRPQAHRVIGRDRRAVRYWRAARLPGFRASILSEPAAVKRVNIDSRA